MGRMVAIGDRVPQVDPGAWLAPGSTVSGAVTVGPGSSIWYGASVRGDGERISIGAGSNVQDNASVHADPGFPAAIGDRVSVGHNAVVHGATVEEGCIVGMGAVLLNGSVVGAGSLVAAGAVVLEGTVLPPGSLVAGAPATVRRPLTDKERARMLEGIDRYQEAMRAHRDAVGEG